MYRFCFVILHYLTYETTAACIESVLRAYDITQYHYDIVVVDNASPNDSLDRLKEHFASSSKEAGARIGAGAAIGRLHWIRSERNLGFAKGNNLGYRYALDKLHADFVIFANNDTLFTQPEFLNILTDCYDNRSIKPALIGPDIRCGRQFHQNPFRDHTISKKELNRWIRNRSLWICFLYADRLLHLSGWCGPLKNIYRRPNITGTGNADQHSTAENVVLHGACMIVTPAFINVFKKYAFYPKTFMYGEEDIIACLCRKKCLTTLYAPSLFMEHTGAVSTELSAAGSITEQELFKSKNLVRSLRILKHLDICP